jgi:hypothetical protein
LPRSIINPTAVEYFQLRAGHPLTQLEKSFWCYNASCEEKAGKRKLKLDEWDVKRDASTVFLTRKEFDEIASNVQKRLFDENGRPNKREENVYKKWLAGYNQRDEESRIKPLMYSPLSPDDPRAIALNKRRAEAGLRNGLTKAGRPKKNI